MFFLGKYICHQNGQIQIFGNEIILPLCLRCTGIYLFLSIGALFFEIILRRFNRRIPLGILIFGTLPMIIDGIFHITYYVNLDYLTFVTGAIFGFCCGIFIMQGIDN
jgi:uncharacterized membrane protein